MNRRHVRRFQNRLRDAPQRHGWRPSDVAPLVTVPFPGTFVRPLDNGWVAVLTVVWHLRDEVKLPHWLPGTHGVVAVEASATFPPAERLGARLEMEDPDFGLAVARAYVGPGREPGYG